MKSAEQRIQKVEEWLPGAEEVAVVRPLIWDYRVSLGR
jgi:hypothetical protein